MGHLRGNYRALALILLLRVGALGQEPAQCVVSDTLYVPGSPGVGLAGARVRVTRIETNGALYSDAVVQKITSPTGTFSISLPRNSKVWIEAPTPKLNKAGGVPVTIPACTTIRLNDLVVVSAVPAQGVVVFDETTAFVNKVGTIKFTGAGVTATESATGIASVNIGGGVWGTITGSLSAQADLNSALAGKASVVHTHSESDITSLIADLAGKQPISPRLTEVAAIGSALQQIRVNAGASALEYFTPNPGLSVGSTPVAAGVAGRLFYEASGNLLGEVSGLVTNGSTSLVQTSNSAVAFESGPNGSTNPGFRLVNNASNAATGLSVTSQAAGQGVIITALSSAANEGFRFKVSGNGTGAGGFLVYDGFGNALFSIDTNLGGVTLATGTAYAWSSGMANSARDTFLSRAAVGNIRLGDAAAATPVPQTLSMQSVAAGISNTAGANFMLAGSQSTGNAVGGSLQFQVSQAGSSGTAVNPLATVFSVSGTGLVATGLNVIGKPAGSGVYVSATSSAADEAVRFEAKGSASPGFVFGFSGANGQQITLDPRNSSTGTAIISSNTGAIGFPVQLSAPVLRYTPSTFANVPGSPVEGMVVSVTDSTTATWGATITGGGSNHVLAYYNGTNWTVVAK